MAKKVVKKTAAKTTKKDVKKPKKTVKEAVQEFFRPDYAALVKQVEKKFHLDSGSMSVEAKRASFMSTGLLTTDLVLGGGILPGAWYTFYGGEGSAKSTHVMHIAQGAVMSNIPIIEYADFEGSLAPDYFEAMMTVRTKGLSFKNVFGVQNPRTGDWEIEPRIKKREYSNGEEFFDPISSMLRHLPDKRYVNGTWFYVYDNTTINRRMIAHGKGVYSPKLFQKYGKFFVEAEDGLAQGIYLTDSYPAMYPEKLDEDDKGAGMAAVARMFSENVPRVLSKLKRKGVAIVGVNQLRLRPMAQGNPEYEPAGEAVKFASSCRMKQAPMVPPDGWARDPDVYGVGLEKSVTGKGKDQYRYISVRNTKNKVSTPWLRSSQRVWIDSTGQGRGFDPAYDTFNYLKMTGQIHGKKNKWTLPTFDIKKPIDWHEFKQLCLLNGKELKEACAAMKLQSNPKIREVCMGQVRKGKALDLMFETIRGKVDKEDDDDSDASGDSDSDVAVKKKKGRK